MDAIEQWILSVIPNQPQAFPRLSLAAAKKGIQPTQAPVSKMSEISIGAEMGSDIRSGARRRKPLRLQLAARLVFALALGCLADQGAANMTRPMIGASTPRAGGLHWGDFSLAAPPEQAMTLCEIVLLRARFRFSRSGMDCIGSRSDAHVFIRLTEFRFEPPPHAQRLPAVNGTQALVVASSSSNARAEQVRNDVRSALTARAGAIQWPLPPTDR